MPAAQAPVTIWEALAAVLRPFSAKTVPKVLTVLYALGLLVTNEASIALQVTDFSLPKYQGIFTGAWCAALVLVGVLPVDACYLLLRKDRPIYEKLLMLPIVMGSVFYISVCATWGILLLFGIGIGSEQHIGNLPAAALPLIGLRVPAVCVWIPLVFLGVAVIESTIAQDLSPTRNRLLLIFGVGALMSTWVLATNVYSHIPKQLGGGWPDRVRLTLTSEGADVWAGLCSGWKSKQTMATGTVELNYSQKDVYIITATLPRSNNDQGRPSAIAIRLNKNLVAAITSRPDDDDESCAPL